MNAHRYRLFLVIAVLLALSRVSSFAVIGVSLTMADLYERSREVVIAEVLKVEARTFQVKVVERPKGGANGDVVALNFAADIELPVVQPGEPVLMFVGLRSTAIHVGDGWFVASASGPATWQVTRNDGPTLDFPGRTRALARVIADVKAGKRTLLYGVEHNVFRGGIRKLGVIIKQPTAVASADVNSDGWQDVLVVSREKAKLFLNHSGDLSETPSPIAQASGQWATAGDINGDGLSDFLVGDTIWLNSANGFTAAARLSQLPEGKVLAAGIGDANGDGRADVLLATEAGEVTIFENPKDPKKPWRQTSKRLWTGGEPVLAAAFSSFWGDNDKPHLLAIRTAGPTRYALGADGGPPAEHRRLAGNPPSWGGPWEILGGTILDLDGNGLPDFYGSGPKFGAILNNRGFGTFLSNYSAKRVHGHAGLAWGELTRSTVLGSADVRGDKCDDVLVATEDGQLFEVNNPIVKGDY